MTLEDGADRCPETSARNCHYSPCNNPEKRSSHPPRGGSLKSRRVLLCVIFGFTESLGCMYAVCNPTHDVPNSDICLLINAYPQAVFLIDVVTFYSSHAVGVVAELPCCSGINFVLTDVSEHTGPILRRLTLRRRIKSHLLFAGVIRSSPFSPR